MTLEGWNYRKSHIITHPTGGLTNYQTKIRVYRTTGTDSGDAVYVRDKCRADLVIYGLLMQKALNLITGWKPMLDHMLIFG